MEKLCVVNYDQVFLDDLNNCVTEEDVFEIKKLATEYKKFMSRNNADYPIEAEYVNARALEIAYNSSKYKNFSPAKKALLAANIVFSDTNKFVSYLSTNHLFSYKNLCTYLKILKYMQNVKSGKCNVSDTNYYNRCENAINTFSKALVNYFQRLVGPVSINTIINKINEVVCLRPDTLKDVLFDNAFTLRKNPKK